MTGIGLVPIVKKHRATRERSSSSCSIYVSFSRALWFFWLTYVTTRSVVD